MSNGKNPDDHFRTFASWLELEIAKYGESNQEHVERQKVQLETLLGLEADFRRELIEHRSGPDVYKDFIVYICNERRNILAARPFFRERQGTFTSEISKHLKQGMFLSLYKFNFNIQFVNFVIRRQKWTSKRLGVRLNDLADKIAKIRTEIVEMNMPLAISRARVFWSRTPKSHLTLMDLVQIAAEGLMSGIDKYVPEGEVVSRRFRSVAIGRMTGNFIEEYSETAIHFYPCDKRKIYRANKVMHKHSGGVDFEKLATHVNTGIEGSHRTSAAELAGLMAASSVVSADRTLSTADPDAPEPVSRFAAPESCQPDKQVENHDAQMALIAAVAKLTVFEQKLLRLKGIRF